MFDLAVGDRSTDTRGEWRAAFAMRGCGPGFRYKLGNLGLV
jgi:hypothetical protein